MAYYSLQRFRAINKLNILQGKTRQNSISPSNLYEFSNFELHQTPNYPFRISRKNVFEHSSSFLENQLGGMCCDHV